MPKPEKQESESRKDEEEASAPPAPPPERKSKSKAKAEESSVPAGAATPPDIPEPVARPKEWFDHVGLGFLKPQFVIPVSDPKPKE